LYFSFYFYIKNYYIIILISFLFYFSFKVSISFLKQLNGHKKKTNVTYTKSLTKKLNPGPHKNTNGTRQKRKVHGTGPNRSGTQNANGSDTNGSYTKRKRQCMAQAQTGAAKKAKYRSTTKAQI
jgi:hypothetical protein